MMGRMKTRKRLAKNQQLLENQHKTGKKPIFTKSVQTLSKSEDKSQKGFYHFYTSCQKYLLHSKPYVRFLK